MPANESGRDCTECGRESVGVRAGRPLMLNARRAASPSVGIGKSVLVVDDSASVRRQIRMALESAGFDVAEAENGERGLAVLRDRPVHLLLVDVNMPVMDGLEMIAKVRGIKEHRDTPIFVLTTESSVGSARRGKAVGATAWIVKPVNPDVLVKGVRGVLAV